MMARSLEDIMDDAKIHYEQVREEVRRAMRALQNAEEDAYEAWRNAETAYLADAKKAAE